MTTSQWPIPPNLDGRPLDTAVLLNRDYELQIHHHINILLDREASVPIHVYFAFANTTETVLNGLCDHGKVHRTAVGPILDIQTAAGAPIAEWPQPPDLQGRPLDTALLLHRDHTRQISHRLQNHPDDVFGDGLPAQVWCSFSENVETLIKALCQHGNIRLNSLNSIPKINIPIDRPRHIGREARREPLQTAIAPIDDHTTVTVEGPTRAETSDQTLVGEPEIAKDVSNGFGLVEIKHERNMVDRSEDSADEEQSADREDSADKEDSVDKEDSADEEDSATKEDSADEEDSADKENTMDRKDSIDTKDSTDTAVNGNTDAPPEDEESLEATESDTETDSGTVTSDSSAASSSTTPPPPLNGASRKAREVNIRHVDRKLIGHLTRNRLRRRLQSSMQDQNLKVTVNTCYQFQTSGDIRLWTTDVKGANILRDAKQWNVKTRFGPEAQVSTAVRSKL
ncbi:MAG: hypothetical protein Q9182_001480 [Xanthomendoza sp. 2 TL-2023]